MTMGKITKVNPEKKIKVLGVKVPKVVAKKGRRTKAELIKQLDTVIETNSTLMHRQINPPMVIAHDNAHYESGYESGYMDGVKAQQEFEAKNKWWKFW